jgi:hypothetical protein
LLGIFADAGHWLVIALIQGCPVAGFGEPPFRVNLRAIFQFDQP